MHIGYAAGIRRAHCSLPVDLEDQEESFFPSLAVVICQELIAHGHIPPSYTVAGAFI